MKYENIFTGVVYDDADDAYEEVISQIDDTDICETAQHEYVIENLIEELRRLESPLYYSILEKTKERFFDDYIRELENDEEDDI